MTESGASSRGFSLFTPLVGTAVVIMAVVIASSMVNNDIRIARTLTSSYEVSSQSMTAKLIKATTELQMIENIETALYDILTDTDQFDLSCSTRQSCIDAAEAVLTNRNKDFMTRMTTGSDGLYNGVIAGIVTVTGYSAMITSTDVSRALRNVAAAGKTTVLVTFPASKYVNVTINSDALRDPKTAGSILAVPFTDEVGNQVVVSIVPDKFSYMSADKVTDMIEKTASAYGNLKNVDAKTALSSAKSADSCYKDDSNKWITAEWTLTQRGPLKITFKTGSC